jgi:hypothetical protein
MEQLDAFDRELHGSSSITPLELVRAPSWEQTCHGACVCVRAWLMGCGHRSTLRRCTVRSGCRQSQAESRSRCPHPQREAHRRRRRRRQTRLYEINKACCVATIAKRAYLWWFTSGVGGCSSRWGSSPGRAGGSPVDIDETHMCVRNAITIGKHIARPHAWRTSADQYWPTGTI